jgi:hypothetical protein
LAMSRALIMFPHLKETPAEVKIGKEIKRWTKKEEYLIL